MGQPEKIFALRNTHSSAVSIKKIIHYHMKVSDSIEAVNKAGLPITKVEAGECLSVESNLDGISIKISGETTEFIVNNAFDSSLGIWHSILIFLSDDSNFEFMEHFYVKVGLLENLCSKINI
jgi:hypothetical protein